MTENNTPEIPDDGRVLAALGINPDNVAKGSFKIHWSQEGQPVVEFTVLQGVSTATLARAFTIAAHPQIPETPEEDPKVPDLASRRRPKPAEDNDMTSGEQSEPANDDQDTK